MPVSTRAFPRERFHGTVAMREIEQSRPDSQCCNARRAALAGSVDQSPSEALTGILGARRAWTVSMISPLSMPCK